ncbi:PD-(D/E)XK nuclease family protein [Bacillus alkalicellulosilyticus]|uniref:PD-(D/E)XK nuclease family protein n=1 Tax=Alkalihalobacterium alkalicellulosilyticum TaxID=1912214 RepID=UPI0009960F97|nr:PD-(D/E)XK nuclease family protein [Bacillus alkalicellulosilyticus]
MNTYIQELKEICEKYPLQDKRIIVDSREIGDRMTESFVKQGFIALNLTVKTVFDIANEQLELTGQDVNVIDQVVGVHLTTQLLQQLKQEGKLTYFSSIEVTYSFGLAIYQAIQQLRLSGYDKDNLPSSAFLSQEKGHDFSYIMSAYEGLLQTYQLIDKASVLIQATQLNNQKHALYILQPNLSLTALESDYLDTIINGNVYQLSLEAVNGITKPIPRSKWSRIFTGKETPLSNIYLPSTGEKIKNLSVFSAKTEEIELKHILQKIIENKCMLDQVGIYYTNAGPYALLMYHLSEKNKIPVTFGEGLPITITRPGRLLVGLVKWLQSNYKVQVLVDLIHDGVIDFGKEAPSKSKVVKLLRALQIGYGKDRYLLQVEKEHVKLLEKKEQAEDDNATSHWQKRIEELTWLQNWMSSIFKFLPNFENTINYKTCLSGFSKVIEQYGTSKSPIDEAAKSKIIDQMTTLIPYVEESLSMYDVMARMKEHFTTLTIMKSNEKPGHLHMTSYQKGLYSSRRHTFIIGLDNQLFPGGASEDPLLLDEERELLHASLPLLKDKPHQHLYSMLQLLAQKEGEITVSFRTFSVSDNRTVAPSFLFLQCYRAIEGNPELDFRDVKKLSSSLAPSQEIEDKDYWVKHLLKDNRKVISDSFFDQFATIQEGIRAEEQRLLHQVTGFDGSIDIETEFDPTLNPERKLTAGKLEKLAACPYAYFLEEILQIKVPEDMMDDPYRWLDPASRGSLLHHIFETFHLKIQENKDRPNYNTHSNVIESIAMNLINQQKEELPPPNERVFQQEVEDILQCCIVFLKEEEEHCKSYEPLYFEYTFGVGTITPAYVTLPSGATIAIAGKIDRVDRDLDGNYHIIDYKTGSTYGYSEKSVFKGGRQLQHFIYAIAIEQHLQIKTGSVQESSYYFPTTKGLGQKFVRKQEDDIRLAGFDVLEKLITIIQKGHFTMTDDPNDCTFCDYKHVCRRSHYEEDTLTRKQMELQAFKGVRAYE